MLFTVGFERGVPCFDGIIIYQLKGLRFLRLQLVRYALFCTILINHIFVDIELVGEDAVVDRAYSAVRVPDDTHGVSLVVGFCLVRPILELAILRLFGLFIIRGQNAMQAILDIIGGYMAVAIIMGNNNRNRKVAHNQNSFKLDSILRILAKRFSIAFRLTPHRSAISRLV